MLPETRADHFRSAAAVFFMAVAAMIVIADAPGWAPYERLACIPIVCGAAWMFGAPFSLLLAVVLASANGSFHAGASSAARTAVVWDGIVHGFELASMAVIVALLRRSRSQAFEIARRDPLTGIANREGFVQRVDAEINRSRRAGRPLSIVYMDGDQFKELNDTFGHLEGDEVLKLVAGTLQQSVRSYDCAARLGGDEFALLLAESSPETARTVVERVRGRLKEALNERDGTLSFSIGVVTFRAPSGSAEELLRTADQAMYEVKHATRDGVRYVVV